MSWWNTGEHSVWLKLAMTVGGSSSAKERILPVVGADQKSYFYTIPQSFSIFMPNSHFARAIPSSPDKLYGLRNPDGSRDVEFASLMDSFICPHATSNHNAPVVTNNIP